MLRNILPARLGHHGGPRVLAPLSETLEDSTNYNTHQRMKDFDQSASGNNTPMATSYDDSASSEYSYPGVDLNEIKGARDISHTVYAVGRHGSSHRRRGSADVLRSPEPAESFEVHLPKKDFKHRRFSLAHCYNQFIEHSLHVAPKPAPVTAKTASDTADGKYLVLGISPPSGVSGTFKETIADLTATEPQNLGRSVDSSATELQKYIENFDRPHKDGSESGRGAEDDDESDDDDDDDDSLSESNEYVSRFPNITSPMYVPRRKSSRSTKETRLLSRSHSPPLMRRQHKTLEHSDETHRTRSYSHGANSEIRKNSLLPKIGAEGQKPSGEKKKNFIAENRKRLAEVAAKNRRKSIDVIDASISPLGSHEKLYSVSRRHQRPEDEKQTPRSGNNSQRRFTSVGLARNDDLNRPPSRDGYRPRAKSFSHFIEKARKLKLKDEASGSSPSNDSSSGDDQESRPRSNSHSESLHSVRFNEAVEGESTEHHEPLPLALYPKHSILKVKEHHYNDEMAPVCYFVTHQEDFQDEETSMFTNAYTEKSVKKAAARFTSLLKGKRALASKTIPAPATTAASSGQ